MAWPSNGEFLTDFRLCGGASCRRPKANFQRTRNPAARPRIQPGALQQIPHHRIAKSGPAVGKALGDVLPPVCGKVDHHKLPAGP